MIKNFKNLISHGLQDLRVPCLKIVDEFLYEIRADTILGKSLRVDESNLYVRNTPIKLSDKIYVVGFGKASAEMAAVLEELLGDRIIEGIINTNHPVKLRRIKVNVCSHPLPDEDTVAKSKEIVKLLKHADSNSLLIFLVSGGASSLFEIPGENTTIREIKEVTLKMLEEGRDITEINKVRMEMSAVKGGKLLKHVKTPQRITLVLSDVIGDDRYVGSGPTFQENDPYYFVLANNDYARRMAASIAQRMGLDTRISENALHGEPKSVAEKIYDEFEKSHIPVLVWGGETSVNVKNSEGFGGRNQELSLYLAKLISGKNMCFVCIGTDGIDGPTDAAGGVVDSLTIQRLADRRVDINAVLNNHDSYHALQILGDLVITGFTGTNLADICIGLNGDTL